MIEGEVVSEEEVGKKIAKFLEIMNFVYDLVFTVFTIFIVPCVFFFVVLVPLMEKNGAHRAENCLASNPWLKFKSKMPLKSYQDPIGSLMVL